jgi:AraC-like DNA-binding protein
MDDFLPRRRISSGVERLPRAGAMPRHQHVEPYVTLVLGGAYEQMAYGGRLRLDEGALVVQPSFDCHSDRMISDGLVLLRLPWRHDTSLGGIYRGCDLDSVRRAAEHDVAEAVGLLGEQLASRAPELSDRRHWTDRLAADLAGGTSLSLGEWADHAGLARETLARGFKTAYGVGPARFRLELRARQAWAACTAGAAELAEIAQDLGFSDQPHMTRAVKWLTGRTPAAWRREKALSTGVASV